MSRIGKKPIKIEDGVKVAIDGKKVLASFGENKTEIVMPNIIDAKIEKNMILIARVNDSKEARSMHGLFAILIKNAITGVKNGFVKELTFTGTGYRVSVDGNEVILYMGYSHETRITITKGLTVTVKKNTISVSGINKGDVGELAAKIREVRPPEVYKGKGIKYKDETIKRKAGKKAATAS